MAAKFRRAGGTSGHDHVNTCATGLTSSTPDSAMRVLTCSRSTTGPNPSTEIVSVRSPDHDAELLQLLQNSVPAVQLDGPQLTATASGEPLPHVGRQQSGHAAPWLIGGRSPYAACAASR